MDYFKEQKLRSWRFDVEQYSRYRRLFIKASSSVCRGYAQAACERIRAGWPKQAKIFNQIDEELP